MSANTSLFFCLEAMNLEHMQVQSGFSLQEANLKNAFPQQMHEINSFKMILEFTNGYVFEETPWPIAVRK